MAHRLVYHSTLGLREGEEEDVGLRAQGVAWCTVYVHGSESLLTSGGRRDARGGREPGRAVERHRPHAG